MVRRGCLPPKNPLHRNLHKCCSTIFHCAQARSASQHASGHAPTKKKQPFSPTALDWTHRDINNKSEARSERHLGCDVYRTGALPNGLLWPWAATRPGASVRKMQKRKRGTSQQRPCVPHWGCVGDAFLGPWAVTRPGASVQDNYKTTYKTTLFC